jgi:monofunctional biosynthetic peptidoglycan transglycosylase
VLWLLTVLVLRFASPPVTTLVIVRQIQSLFTSHAGMREWRWIGSDELPAHVLQAVVTAEDARFMKHMGVDLLAVGDALDAVGGKRRLRGASTITMQTVKNIYLWPGRSYVRKAVEWCMAPIVGVVWGKRRTLELYLNVIEWGEGIYGIESAARHYYHKSASKLSVHEAAALAAILPNPRKLSPLAMVQSTRRRYGRIVRELHMTPVPARRQARAS